MTKVIIEEKALYLTIFILALFNKILGSITDVENMYMSIVNNKILTLIYIPMFLFILLRNFSKRMKPEIIIRYENIYKWNRSNLKIIIALSTRFCIIFNFITSIFMISCNTDMLLNSDFYVFNYISIIIQIVGWSLIGMLFLNMIFITNSIKLAYVLEIILFLALRIIMSPLSFIAIRDFIIPIWDTMFFYQLNDRNYMTMIKYLFMNVVIITILYLIYGYLCKIKDIKTER